MGNIMNKLFVVISLSVAVLLTACKDDNYLKYDISYSGIYFTKDTLKYSFSVTPVEINSYEFKVPFKIMGALHFLQRFFRFYTLCLLLSSEGE